MPSQDPPVGPPVGGQPEQQALPGHSDRPKRAGGERKRPAHQRPADWKPNEGHYQRGQKLGIERRKVDDEADRFRHFHDAKGNVFASWDAAFHTWIGNAQRFAGGGRPAHQPAAKPGQQAWTMPKIITAEDPPT